LPAFQGDYYAASPCKPADLQQGNLESILLCKATQDDFKVRVDTKLVEFSQKLEGQHVESVIEDLVTHNRFVVRSKFLCGADGAHSSIIRQLQVPMRDEGGGGLALYVHIEADLVCT
jgi:2-polyprenyl-6-methoxyphenol hydroxylase-like FAD-dependent oxidoreductase